VNRLATTADASCCPFSLFWTLSALYIVEAQPFSHQLLENTIYICFIETSFSLLLAKKPHPAWVDP
jgi:hypothetical protein